MRSNRSPRASRDLTRALAKAAFYAAGLGLPRFQTVAR